MKTKYSTTLSNGQSVEWESKVPNYVVAIQGVNWKGEIAIIWCAKTMESGQKKADWFQACGIKEVKLLNLSVKK